jgi:hypothetical protein
MTIRSLVLAACLAGLSATLVAQQPSPATAPAPRISQPTTAPAPAGQPAPPAPRREGQPINVKVEVTITDQGGGGTPALKKTVTVVTADQMSGFIRSVASYSGPVGTVPLNVDIEPQILTDNRIRLRVNLQYTLPGDTKPLAADNPSALRRTEIHENLALILESGKPLIVAQSADPVGDRQVTIEIRATVLR